MLQPSMGHDTARAIAELIGQVIWAMTPAGELMGDSPSWRALTGQSLEEAQGRGWMDAVHPEDREEQVVENLLGNAIKYGAGKPIHVEVTAEPEHARLVVRDQGIGIEAAAMPRIFDMFERAPSARHFGGLGLGLFIVRQITENHGGTIRVSSEPQRGSTFIVELPLRR